MHNTLFLGFFAQIWAKMHFPQKLPAKNQKTIEPLWEILLTNKQTDGLNYRAIY